MRIPGYFSFQEVYSVKSPFSLSNNYTVTSVPFRPRFFPCLTPREILAQTVLSSCGAAAALTLERFWPKGKGQARLKSLAAAGFMARHVLDGNIRLNIYSTHPRFEPDQGLRQLALAQLFVRLRECVPCYLTPAEPFPVLTVMGRHFQVIVLRDGDYAPLLHSHLRHPSVVVCETLTPLPGYPVRMTADHDLINRPLEECFYLPDGTPDRESFLARLSSGASLCAKSTATG